MGCARASPAILNILNIFQVVFGLALSAVAIWFYIEVQTITGLRNPNRYLLDFNIYWPQAVPWLFLVIGVLLLCISCCGFAGATNKSKLLVNTYIVFEVIAILILLVSAVVVIVFGDSNSTEKFVIETIYEVFEQSKTNPDVELAYGSFESRYQCCGSAGPREYVTWRNKFPKSCCGSLYEDGCDFSNKFANEKFGCSKVAVNYTKLAIRMLAAASAFTAFVGIINVIIAVVLSMSLKKKSKKIAEYHETESKKVLL